MKSPWYNNAKSLRYKLCANLNKVSRGYIPHPCHLKSMEHYKNSDDKRNIDCTPSDDLHLESIALWAFEMYTISDIEKLQGGIASLNLDKIDPFGEKSVLSWIKQSRSGYGNIRINLGKIIRPGAKDSGLSFTNGLHAVLPDFADYAYVYLYAITPSITCLAICFGINSENRPMVEKAMRRYYSTTSERYMRWFRYYEPYHHKQLEIKNIRMKWRGACINWMRQHFSGQFVKLGLRTPVCEACVIDMPSTLDIDDDSRRNPLFSLSGLDIIGTVFEDKDHEGVYFLWDLFRDDKIYSAIAMDKKSLEKFASIPLGKPIWPDYYVKLIFEYYTTTITKWACLCFLNLLEGDISEIRDTGRALVLSRSPVLILERLRKLTSNSIDITSICNELDSATSSKSCFSHDIANMALCGYNDSYILSDMLISQVKATAKRIKTINDATKDYILQQSSLINAHESMKLQKYVYILTVIASVATVISAYKPLTEIYGEIVNNWGCAYSCIIRHVADIFHP